MVSLGCPKNQVDTERILASFALAGWMICEDPADADLILINTCGFIESARDEALAEIERAVQLKQEGLCQAVAVVGCLVQLWGRDFARRCPAVDAWAGICEPDHVVALCEKALQRTGASGSLVQRARSDIGPRLRITPRHYAYLRVAEGCDNRCAYCQIPSIRGPLCSRPMDQILDEARELHDDGVRELCLIAQDTAGYGVDLYHEQRLPELIRRLSALDMFHWIRLLYVHPAHCSDELIRTVAQTPQVCKYLDLPIQHINDELLERMNRRTTGEGIRRLIGRLREQIDGLVLRTSLIVGLPGETLERFEELMAFVKETRFERLGAFAYSPEAGTAAATLDGQVPAGETIRRLDELMLAHQQIALEHAQSRVGQKIECVVDAASAGGRWSGRTYGDAPEIDTIIELTGRGLHPGAFGSATVTAANGYDLAGRMDVRDDDQPAESGHA